MGIFSYYKEEAQEKLLVEPNKANGHDMANYSWGQTLEEVTITIPLPHGASVKNSSYFSISIENSNYIKVGKHLQPLIINGQLYKKIKADEWKWSCISHVKKDEICIVLPKEKNVWWKSLFKDGPQIDTQKFEGNKWWILIPKLWENWKRYIFG
ncbi:hypothetical protein T459_07419 [Capsicum annuum]|uniref:CS domain-containing protein n=1 Tax=Capsicum annuum TaxID=4072 RepID=A0A2G2ZTM5_CAPAN|nr:hypothetical protein T459_07419 [Capsicum annuum]